MFIISSRKVIIQQQQKPGKNNALLVVIIIAAGAEEGGWCHFLFLIIEKLERSPCCAAPLWPRLRHVIKEIWSFVAFLGHSHRAGTGLHGMGRRTKTCKARGNFKMEISLQKQLNVELCHVTDELWMAAIHNFLFELILTDCKRVDRLTNKKLIFFIIHAGPAKRHFFIPINFTLFFFGS